MTKLNAAGSGLVYSTFLGGDGGRQRRSPSRSATKERVFVSGGHRARPTSRRRRARSTSRTTATTSSTTRSSRGSTRRARSSCTRRTSAAADDDSALFGLGVDEAGNAVLSGYTDSADLPTTPNALDTTYDGGSHRRLGREARDGGRTRTATATGFPTTRTSSRSETESPRSSRRTRAPRPPTSSRTSLAKVDSAIAKLAAAIVRARSASSRARSAISRPRSTAATSPRPSARS